MRILALETATVVCAIGLRDADGIDHRRVLDRSRRHTEVLTGGVRELLASCGVPVGTLERVVVDVGPGLFTGLRVGIAAAQALASGLGADLVGVSSLEVLACAAEGADVDGEVVAVVDARRGEVFAQRFSLTHGVTAHGDARVTSPEALAAELEREPATITGDGALRYAAVLAPVARDLLALDAPPVGTLLALGATATPTATVAPRYLREADAVANFSTRDRR